MNDIQKKAIRRIEELQGKLQQGSAPWVVGEQLKEICEREPASAELLLDDLKGSGMGLADAEKKIKAYADKHKTRNFAYVSPQKAEEILREFYGLGPSSGASRHLPPEGKAGPSSGASRHLPPEGKAEDGGTVDVDLEDFF